MDLAIWVLVGLMALALVLFALAILRRKPTTESGEALNLLTQRLEDVGALKSKLDAVASVQDNLRNSLASFDTALKGVETKVTEATGSVKESVLRDFGETRKILTEMRTELEERKSLEQELRKSSRRIEAVIAGSRARGQAGENILEEAFREFPPHIVETNLKVKGHVVEYALVLADGKRVPIDSKWTTPELIESLDVETDETRRQEIIAQVEQTLRAKVKEVTKYIDPAVTVSWAIAAVPDSVFAVCRRSHLDAFRDQVVVMPFSLTIIYLLTLYQLHLQYCRSVDAEKVEAYLNQMEASLERLDEELENRVIRGATMITNAFHECKRLIGEMRGSAAYLRTLPPGETAPLGISQSTQSED